MARRSRRRLRRTVFAAAAAENCTGSARAQSAQRSAVKLEGRCAPRAGASAVTSRRSQRPVHVALADARAAAQQRAPDARRSCSVDRRRAAPRRTPKTCGAAGLDDRQRAALDARAAAASRSRATAIIAGRPRGCGKYGAPLSFRRERVGVDRTPATRVAPGSATAAGRASGRSSGAALQRQRRVERRCARRAASRCGRAASRPARHAPRVPMVHAHERRDVESLVEAALDDALVAVAAQHVRVALAPGRVRDLGDDGLDALAAAS